MVFIIVLVIVDFIRRMEIIEMSECNYCHEEMPMPSRHEPNCNLNPVFQNRLSKGWRALNGMDET